MINISDVSMYFGDLNSSPFSIEEFKSEVNNKNNKLEQKLNDKLNDLKFTEKNYFIHQVHGNIGLIIDKPEIPKSFDYEGDFTITNQKNLTIGILTADCLPIIYFDNKQKIIAIAHAGWRGTIKNIAISVIENMMNSFNCKKEDIQIFFGPSAKTCCYKVDNDFHLNVNSDLKNETLINKNSQNYFDIPLYNKLLIENFGIRNINTDNNVCTICNKNFWSYRRDNLNSGLQISMVVLRK